LSAAARPRAAGNALALVDALKRETDIPVALRAWEPDQIQFGLHLRRQGKLLGDQSQKRYPEPSPDEEPLGEVQQTVGDHRPAALSLPPGRERQADERFFASLARGRATALSAIGQQR
jgi:hypothetical protein